MIRRLGLAATGLIWIVWLGMHGVVFAQVEEGERLYKIHCQACHGDSGKGEGTMREQLEIVPPDLTILARENGGEFPTERIQRVIDGRSVTPAHGSREMPVWGFTFQASGTDSLAEKDVQALVTALTQYLESIQIETVEDGRHRAPDD